LQESTYKSDLIKICGENVKFNEPMKKHTSFKIGGPAEMLIEPENEEQFKCVIKRLKEDNISYCIIGAGSNLLVGDKGISGAVIKMAKDFGGLSLSGDTITAGSGVMLSKLANFAASNGLSGLEFAGGIPGTVGGAVYMNAGAYGGEMKDVVISTRYMTDSGEIKEITGDEHKFVYRGSVFSSGGYILSTTFKLNKKPEEEIRAVMKDLNGRRRDKQPLEYPSAGSTFKRPEGYFAAKLIEDAELKGASVGGAAVSEKHAGFVINKSGEATAKDVLKLVELIKERVMEKFGVELSCEIKMIGDF
jgi:UDP-N-acetylmuramate dehydrogenase